MASVKCNDGVALHFVECGGEEAQPLVLIHGWSASHRSFDNTIPQLAKHFHVYAPDLRFHGDSDKPSWGFHVSRLAADLHDFLNALGIERPILLGTSLGCAVIWAYVELYGDVGLNKLVFVDQAPSQWKMTDWSFCSKGIYDAASLTNIQTALSNMNTFADGNAECCLSHQLDPNLLEVLKQETLKCDPVQLGKLMADHAQLDWRPILPRISVPCLNLYGTCSGCFPVEGCRAVGEMIPNCKNVEFEGYNHWLYLENPDAFVTEVVAFGK
ncbi:MAG: hypothetical protein SGPRY_003609 [Prymnesium sp.]